jgi:hypothetical protein
MLTSSTAHIVQVAGNLAKHPGVCTKGVPGTAPVQVVHAEMHFRLGNKAIHIYIKETERVVCFLLIREQQFEVLFVHLVTAQVPADCQPAVLCCTGGMLIQL